MQKKIIKIVTLILIFTAFSAGCTSESDSKSLKYHQKTASFKQANNILSTLDESKDTQKKQALILTAAENYIEADLIQKASDTLKKIEVKKLTSSQLTKMHLLQARIFFNSNDAIRALEELTLEPDDTYPTQNNVNNQNNKLAKQELFEDKVEINKQKDGFSKHIINNFENKISSNPLEELKLRIKLDSKISISHDLANQNKKNIWFKLVAQDNQTIKKLILETRDASVSAENKIFLGWLELTNISQNGFNKTDVAFINEIKTWLSKYPNHPATEFFVGLNTELINEATIHNPPSKIAILLPLTGNLAPAAKVIKDGILNAYYNDKSKTKPEITIIDTKNNPNDIQKYYQQALDNKADVIIGPLNKTSVKNLKKNKNNTVPIIALNYIYDDFGSNNNNMYQFGISAEDEAEQAAIRAWKAGTANTLVLADDNDWGLRVNNAYKDKYQTLDGIVSQTIFVNPTSDYKKTIYSNLGLEQSQKRKNTLQWIVGRTLDFQPRRRQDFDNIFLATSSNTAKLLKPILKFYYSDNVPIYATSNILNYKRNDKTSYKDLADIEYCDIPLIIHSNQNSNKLIDDLRRTWPENYENFIRLYALGSDSYILSNNLAKLALIQDMGVTAHTGYLVAKTDGKIHRHLPWVKIKNNEIVSTDVL